MASKKVLAGPAVSGYVLAGAKMENIPTFMPGIFLENPFSLRAAFAISIYPMPIHIEDECLPIVILCDHGLRARRRPGSWHATAI